MWSGFVSWLGSLLFRELQCAPWVFPPIPPPSSDAGWAGTHALCIDTTLYALDVRHHSSWVLNLLALFTFAGNMRERFWCQLPEGIAAQVTAPPSHSTRLRDVGSVLWLRPCRHHSQVTQLLCLFSLFLWTLCTTLDHGFYVSLSSITLVSEFYYQPFLEFRLIGLSLVPFGGIFFHFFTSLSFTLHFLLFGFHSWHYLYICTHPTLTMSIGLYGTLWTKTYTNTFHRSPPETVLAIALVTYGDHFVMDICPLWVLLCVGLQITLPQFLEMMPPGSSQLSVLYFQYTADL